MKKQNIIESYEDLIKISGFMELCPNFTFLKTSMVEISNFASLFHI